MNKKTQISLKSPVSIPNLPNSDKNNKLKLNKKIHNKGNNNIVQTQKKNIPKKIEKNNNFQSTNEIESKIQNEINNQTKEEEETKTLNFKRILKKGNSQNTSTILINNFSRTIENNSVFYNSLFIKENDIENKKINVQNHTKTNIEIIKTPFKSLENYNVFEIEDVLLGKGSFGSVYRINSSISNKCYALKIFESKSCDKDIYLKHKFYNEITIMKKLKENKALGSIEYIDTLIQKSNNEEKENLMLLMELCDCSLDDIIKIRAENSLEWKNDELTYYFILLLSNLFELFNLNIVHRDIKPKNILYSINSNKYKFADFGEAKYCPSNKLDYNKKIEKTVFDDQTITGTPYYMCPEIYNNYKENKFICKYDPFSGDLYSLGISFINMITLKTSINRSEINELIFKLNENILKDKIVKNLLLENWEDRIKNITNLYENNLKNIKFEQIPKEENIIKLLNLNKQKSKNQNENFLKLLKIGELYKILKNSKKSIEIYEKLNTEIEKIPIDNTTRYIKFQCTSKLGSLYVENEKQKEGVILLENALNTLMNELINTIPEDIFKNDKGDLLNELGIAFKKIGDIDKAVFYYKMSFNLAIEIYGHNSINAIITQNNLALLYLELEKYHESKILFEKVLEILEKSKKQYESDQNLLNDVNEIIDENKNTIIFINEILNFNKK